MTLRKPTLDEWFLGHQLRSLQRNHFYNPAHIEVDITPLAQRYRDRGVRPSFPAILIKAVALTAREVPAINRAYLRTPLGERIAEFDHISVNMPVALREDGRTYLSASVVRDADTRTVADITDEIRRAQRRPIDDTRVTKIAARKPNNVLWRSVLRGVHYAAYRWPALAARAGGGLSVSSVLEHGDRTAPFRCVSYGPTATTVLLSDVRHGAGDRTILDLGLGLDHVALDGVTFRRMADVLHGVLSTDDPDVLAELE